MAPRPRHPGSPGSAALARWRKDPENLVLRESFRIGASAAKRPARDHDAPGKPWRLARAVRAGQAALRSLDGEKDPENLVLRESFRIGASAAMRSAFN